MTWMELILRMLLCLLIAGIIGAVIGWLLRSLFGSNKNAELEEAWQSKLAGKEREWEMMRAESRKQLAATENKLTECHAGVETHLATIAAREAKYAELQVSFDAKAAAHDQLSAEVTALQNKLAAAESAATDWQGKLTTAEASLTAKHSELGDLTTKLAAAAALAATLRSGSDEAEKLKAENALLRQRLSGLEADLGSARAWEAKYQALLSERDGLQQQLGTLQATSKAQASDWEMKALAITSDKEREIQELQKRVRELEPLGAQAKDWEVKYLAVLDEKQQESMTLRNRVAELEPLSGLLTRVQSDVQAKEAALHTLQARVQELEATRTAIAPDLEAIEGIGPVYFQKLSDQAGIRWQKELLEQGQSAAGRKEIAEKTGILEALILRWVNHCDLRRINGVTEQYAELLEVAGVDTVPELAQRNADNLHAKVVATNEEKHISPQTPTADDIQQWVAQAKTLPRVVTH